MLIDLHSKEFPSPEQRKRNLVRARLACKTIRQLGDFAREHGISLSAAPTKQDMVNTIMAEYGKSWGGDL